MLREEMLQTALANWQDRLANLELAKSITSDPNKRFDIEKQIEYCLNEIKKAKENIASDLGQTEIREQLRKSEAGDLLNWNSFSEVESSNAVSSEGNKKESKSDAGSQQTTLASSLYAQKLDAWQRSHGEDKSNLLAGRALSNEIERLAESVIDPKGDAIEHTFLLESIVWERDREQRESFIQNWRGNEKLLRPHFDRGMNAWKKSEYKNRGALLRGVMLKRTTAWASSNILSQQERNFLLDSIIEDTSRRTMILEDDKREVSKLIHKEWQRFSRASQNPYSVFREILTWTECQPFLTQKVCEYVSLSNSVIPAGDERQRIQSIVEKKFDKDSKDREIAQHFCGVYSLLVRNENHNAFWLLFTYRKILKEQRIGDDYEEVRMSTEFLEDVGLLVEKKGELQVRNGIYRSVFNLDWAEQSIFSSRPYAKKLLGWLDSNCQDDTQLLNEQEMQDAMIWAQENNEVSTPMENKFLAYSLDL